MGLGSGLGRGSGRVGSGRVGLVGGSGCVYGSGLVGLVGGSGLVGLGSTIIPLG